VEAFLMVHKKYVQTLQERDQLHQRVSERASKAPETYKEIFDNIYKNSDGVAEPDDPIEIVRVWFSSVAFAFNDSTSTYYPEDIQQLIDEIPENVLTTSILPQFESEITHLNEVIQSIKIDMDQYMILQVEQERLGNELDNLCIELGNKRIREEEAEDRDKDIRIQEHNHEFSFSRAHLFEIVNTLCAEYSTTLSSDVSIGSGRSYAYIEKELPQYIVMDWEDDSRFGYHTFRVEKLYTIDADTIFFGADTYKALPRLADGAKYYDEIGYLIVREGHDDNSSIFSVKTNNPDLYLLFKEVRNKILALEKTDVKKQSSNNKEPWQKSRPNKRERDKIIWNMREDGSTWEEIAAELANQSLHTAVSTIKENYSKMKELK
jgi:hypothetical protein